ncbi:MAG TPA: hypothetical protein VLX29_10745 [Nitrospirota bacterium]|nr:hypothetical protein [Nitrospirota bacterium]
MKDTVFTVFACGIWCFRREQAGGPKRLELRPAIGVLDDIVHVLLLLALACGTG